jgi:hypothetical protein
MPRHSRLFLRRLPAEERFHLSYQVAENGCWLWLGAPDRKGYGAITVAGKMWKAHQFSYYLHREPIPQGLCVLHNCPGGDNPACVNPAHLFLGTIADNNADMRAKGRHAFGERHGSATITEEEIDTYFCLIEAGWRQRDLVHMFGICSPTISRILSGKRRGRRA